MQNNTEGTAENVRDVGAQITCSASESVVLMSPMTECTPPVAGAATTSEATPAGQKHSVSSGLSTNNASVTESVIGETLFM